jgi:hypothetical protein
MDPIANQLNKNPKNLKIQSSTILVPTDVAPPYRSRAPRSKSAG